MLSSTIFPPILVHKPPACVFVRLLPTRGDDYTGILFEVASGAEGMFGVSLSVTKYSAAPEDWGWFFVSAGVTAMRSLEYQAETLAPGTDADRTWAFVEHARDWWPARDPGQTGTGGGARGFSPQPRLTG